MMDAISPTYRALVLDSVKKDLSGIQIKTLKTPNVEMGSVLVRVLSTGLVSYQKDIYDGSRDYPLPRPLTGGFCAVGRVVAVGRDALIIRPGTLVFVDTVVRGRDDLEAMILSFNSDGFPENSQKLMKDVWRDGTFAEYVKFPLESCLPLNETKLCSELGYSTQELAYIGYLLVAFGGLRDINLEAGETVIICPATGGFGGAGVAVAVAMGAQVIAMGRNEKELERLQKHIKSGTPGAKVNTLRIEGDEEKDTSALRALGTIDAILDLSPPSAGNSTYLFSALKALRHKGRVSLMGGFPERPINSFELIAKNITIKGKFMYERSDVHHLIKMLENGRFPLGKDFVQVENFSLDAWREALDKAASHTGVGKYVVMNP